MSQPAYPDRQAPKAQPYISDEGEFSFIRLLTILLRHLKFVVAFAVLFALYTLGTGLLTPLTYTADASFIPQGSRAQSQASAFAAQFGVGIQTGEGGQSPQFYIDLIRSREIQRGVVRSSYTVRTDTGVITGNLIRILGIRGRGIERLEYSAMRTLADMVTASPSPKTGVITLKATSGYPELSSQILANVLDQINKFNLLGRQSRASSERRFIEQRLREGEVLLTQAEDRLDEFNRANRDFITPTPALQRDRLNRTVVARQQIVTALMQAEEQARIEEIRDTPAITVIEPPARPLEPNQRGIRSRTIKSVIFGFVLGSIAVFLLDFFRRSAARDGDAFQEFVATFRRRLRRPSIAGKSAS